LVRRARRERLVVVPYHAERVRAHHEPRGVPNPVPVQAIVERLGEATLDPLHEFWADDVSIVDRRDVDALRIHGPRQVTDVYLLALAVKHSGRFVTFDGRVSIGAVPGAEKKNLLML
jgi:predicted nucleic acid-binding protein